MPIAKKTEVKSVKKFVSAPTQTVTPEDVAEKCACGSRSCKCCSCRTFGKKLILTLVGLLLVYLIFYFGVSIRNMMKQHDFIGQADKSERFITVSGTGKVNGTNDVAVTTIGYSNVAKNVTDAQTENKKVMEKVMDHLKKMGISDDDLKSDYAIYPEYNYTSEGGSELVGYRVTQSVVVKVRDLSKVEEVLSLAGLYGANQVSGLQFTIDDESVLKKQARDKALEDAAKNLKYLTETLGIKVGKVVNYSEYNSGDDMYYKSMVSSESAYGMGGGAAPVSSGSQEVTGNVSITYELL